MGTAGAAQTLNAAARALLLALILLAPIACSHRPLKPARSDAGSFHTVQAGETVSSIARSLGASPEAIAQENALDDPDRLIAGRVLWIPRSPQPAPIAPAPLVLAPAPPAGDAALASDARLLWPVHGVLISRFGDRHGEHHEGIDLAAPEGTHVVAAAAGVVVFAGEQRGYGQLILLAHRGDLVTVYAHNQENLVHVGEKVERGQALARIGRTGNATGPHLHFEVRSAEHPVDPLPFLGVGHR